MSGYCLVFGGEGQLGRDLSRAAHQAGQPVYSVSRRTVDVTDARKVRETIEEIRPAIVINAAAYTRVDDAETETEAARDTNALGPEVLARTCEEFGAALIYVSTDYVFDGTKIGSYSERDPVCPIGAYGMSKAMGEKAVRACVARHMIVRTSWLYGEFGQNFLKTILRLALERDEIRVVNDQHGCPTSTRDLARAIVRVSRRLIEDATVSGTYHFAGDGATTWHGLAERVAQRVHAMTGKATHVRPITTAEYPTKARRPQNSALDCSKFAATFGFKGRRWDLEASEIAEILIRADRIPTGQKATDLG